MLLENKWRIWVSGSNEGSKLMLGHDTAKESSFEKTNFDNPRSLPEDMDTHYWSSKWIIISADNHGVGWEY